MKEKTEYAEFRFDTLKWGVIWGLIVIGIAANFYFAKVAVALRLIGWLILACVLCGIAFYTKKGRQTWEFAQESRTELRKVVWPTRQETVKVTVFIVIIVMIVAAALWLIDSLLLWAMSFLTGQRG